MSEYVFFKLQMHSLKKYFYRNPFIFCAVIGDRFRYLIKIQYKHTFVQTHHNIKTADKLVPGMFYRIILLKKNALNERQKHVDIWHL